MNDSKLRRSSQGFTVVELLVVITVIAVLASLTLMAGRGAVIKGKRSKTQAVMMGIESGLDKYKTDYAEYPEPTVIGPGLTDANAWASAECLYQALSGDGTDRIKGVTPVTSTNGTLDQGENYVIEIERDWWDSKTPRYAFQDAFAHPFQYRHYTDKTDRASKQLNSATYDLWSYAEAKAADSPGVHGEARSATADDKAKWIGNWK